MDTLIYVHVPKTAGTSLRNYLWERFPQESQRFQVKNDIPGDKKKLSALPEEAKAKLGLVFGHICYGWHLLLPQNRCLYTTMLRNPVDRVISLYYYIKKSNGHYLNKPTEKMSLKDFVESGVTLTADNAQVRQLCNEDCFLREPYADMQIPFGKVTEAHLEQAKRNLEKMIAVGVSEFYGMYVKVLCERFGWPIPPVEYKNVTKHPGAERLPSATIQAVMDHNRLDWELYLYAVEVAYDQFASL